VATGCLRLLDAVVGGVGSGSGYGTSAGTITAFAKCTFIRGVGIDRHGRAGTLATGNIAGQAEATTSGITAISINAMSTETGIVCYASVSVRLLVDTTSDLTEIVGATVRIGTAGTAAAVTVTLVGTATGKLATATNHRGSRIGQTLGGPIAIAQMDGVLFFTAL